MVIALLREIGAGRPGTGAAYAKSITRYIPLPA